MSDHLPVIHQTLASAFATEPGFLVAAERRRRVELIKGVRPDHARLEQRAHLENPRAFVRPDTRRQPVHRVVGFLDGFFEGAESQHAQHRPEDFFAGYAVALRDTSEYRRFEVES